MIRIASAPVSKLTPVWHELFIRMLPTVRQHAQVAFCPLDPESRAEATQNAICNACAAVARLAELNKLDLCYPRVLSRFAIAQTRDGRMLGRPLNCKDVASKYCQRQKNIVVERLDRYDSAEQMWMEILIPDQTCTPPELAASRIDFPAWLKTLKPRVRGIAQFLARGNRTSDAARKFDVSQGRISQLRKELKAAWEEFTGDAEPPETAAVPA